MPIVAFRMFTKIIYRRHKEDLATMAQYMFISNRASDYEALNKIIG